MKRLTCLTVSFLLMMAVFTGCGNNITGSSLYDPDIKIGDTGGLKMPLTKNNETISWVVKSSATNLNSSYVAETLRKVTGVNIELVVIPASTTNQKLKILAASDDLPDITPHSGDSNFMDEMCVQGGFYAVEDYLDYTPNFKKIFYDTEESNWIPKSYSASDGKMYAFYGWGANRTINTGVWLYRKDIFDKHGIKMWNSPETFYEALKELKNIYPDSTPLAMKTGDATFQSLAKHFGLNAHSLTFMEDSKKWVYTDTTDEYRDFLDFIKRLYDEGLMDPEFVTATQASWTAKMVQENKAFVTCDWLGRISMFKQQTTETIPNYDLRFAPSINNEGKYDETKQTVAPRYVFHKCKNPELAFSLLDFVLSPAGAEIVTMGIEGETYTIGEDGMADYIEFPDKTPATTELSEKYGMFLEGMYLSFDKRSAYYNFTPEEKEAQDYMEDPAHVRPLRPELVFTGDETSEKTEYLVALEKESKEFAINYVFGNNTGDKAWDDWCKKAEKLGKSQLEEIQNNAQKRYDNNK